MKISLKDVELSIIKYLWVLILLPKTVQFALFIVLLIYMFGKSRMHLDAFAKVILLLMGVSLLAILVQVIVNNPTNSRLAAAINTSTIWGIAVLFYCFFLNKEQVSAQYLEKFARYATINFGILFFVWILSLLIQRNEITILGLTYNLKKYDYLTSGTTTRFCGLMDTLLCPSHFYIIQFPIIFLNGIVNKLKSRTILLTGLLGMIPVYATHSRSGIIICTILYFICIVYLVRERAKNKNFVRALYVVFAGIAVALMIYMIPELKQLINSFVNGRAGSNSTRMSIYINSITTAWNESPLIGIGIKYMVGRYPLGSHSTYIGMFYKAGIIGCILFVLAFYNLYSRLYRKLQITKYGKAVLIMLLCYLPFLVFADLDATDWIIVCFFSACGLILNPRFNMTSMEEQQNETS